MKDLISVVLFKIKCIFKGHLWSAWSQSWSRLGNYNNKFIVEYWQRRHCDKCGKTQARQCSEPIDYPPES